MEGITTPLLAAHGAAPDDEKTDLIMEGITTKKLHVYTEYKHIGEN